MSATLIKKAKITPRKHIYLGVTEKGYLFVIRHLVPVEEEYKEWKTIYTRISLKIVETHYHISKETFETMISMYVGLVYPPVETEKLEG